MAEPTYATREQVARATDVKSSAAVDDVIDRKAAAASRKVERMLHRRFYPLTASRTFDWPRRGAVWLDDDLLSATAVTIDGTAVTGHVLEPRFDGPPYDRIDFEDATIGSGDELTVTGAWGYSTDEATAGALAAAITDAAATSCTVTDASLVGVGDLLRIDTERLVVTDRGLASTGTTLGSNIDALAATVSVPVGSGAAVHAGETITIDAERMLVIDVAANTLIVRRAVDGSVITAHSSGATVYAPRLLTVARGAAGTTAATHLISAAVVRNVPPAPVTELVIAETVASMQQDLAGWARTAGTGAAQQGVAPEGLEQLRASVDAAYHRWRLGRAI